MSRIGAKAITIPSGVQVNVQGRNVSIKGPKGELNWQLPYGIDLSVQGTTAKLSRTSTDSGLRRSHGLARALVANMVKGVGTGFQKSLQIEGVGFRAAIKGKNLEMTLGFSHPVVYPVPADVKIVVESPTVLHVQGADRQRVGQVAAEIRALRKPEPYKGKGIRYNGERIRRKAGKTAA